MSDLCPIAVSEGSNDVEEQPETFTEANLKFLKEKRYCDVTFTFPNLPDRIQAHEYCLKVRSPVFEKIFRMRKSGNVHGKEIEVSESTPQRFQEFLEFIYADKFNVNVAGALDLLHLAQNYKIQPLTNKCEELLKTEIKVEDSVQVFETARRYGRTELVDQAGDIMVKSLAYLIEIDALASAQEGTLVYLLERDDLTVKEDKLFEFVLKWGKDQVTPSDEEQVLKDKLKKVTPLIRYTNMSPNEFNTVVLPTGLLSGEEMLSVYSYLAANEVMRKDMTIKFSTTPRNPEFGAIVDFYATIEDAMPRSQSTSFNPLKLCISFEVQAWKKLWSDVVLKKPAITGIKVKWPSRIVQNSRISDGSLNFNVCVKECSGPVNDQNVRLIFEKKLLNCKAGDEDEIKVEPAVELKSGVTYCVIVEDQAIHHESPVYGYTIYQVNYIYSGNFCPYGLSPQASVDLGGVDLKLNKIQKDNRLSGFSNSTQGSLINIIRGINIALV